VRGGKRLRTGDDSPITRNRGKNPTSQTGEKKDLMEPPVYVQGQCKKRGKSDGVPTTSNMEGVDNHEAGRRRKRMEMLRVTRVGKNGQKTESDGGQKRSN